MGPERYRLIAATREHHDPRLIRQLEAAQERADTVSTNMLVALASTIADRMEETANLWNSEAINQDAYLNDLPMSQEPDKQKRYQELQAEVEGSNKQYGPKLSAIFRQADDVRREILQKLPPTSRTAEDKEMETKFSAFRKAPTLRRSVGSQDAGYIRQLGQRLSKETQ